MCSRPAHRVKRVENKQRNDTCVCVCVAETIYIQTKLIIKNNNNNNNNVQVFLVKYQAV